MAKVLDTGLSTKAAGKATMPSWMKDYVQTGQSYTARKNAALAAAAQSAKLTAGTRSMAYGYTPNWMQPYLPTQPVQAAPLEARKARTGRGGQVTERTQGTAPMYGPGQSPADEARRARSGRGGQLPADEAWRASHPFQSALLETMKSSGGFTGTGGGYIPNYVPESVEQAGTRTPEQKALAALMERTGGVPVGPGSSWINKLAQAVPWGGALSNLETPEWMHNMADYFTEGGYPEVAFNPEAFADIQLQLAGALPKGTTPQQVGEWWTPAEQIPAAPPGEGEKTMTEEREKHRRREANREHYIQIMYQRTLDRLINSLDYGGGGGDWYAGPSGGYWGGGGGGGYWGGGGGGGYSPEESFWLNLARWNI